MDLTQNRKSSKQKKMFQIYNEKLYNNVQKTNE